MIWKCAWGEAACLVGNCADEAHRAVFLHVGGHGARILGNDGAADAARGGRDRASRFRCRKHLLTSEDFLYFLL